MSVDVREAEPSDIPWLLEQLRAFDASFPAERSLFADDERVTMQLRQAISVGPFYVAEVAEGYPVGFVYGLLHPHPLNPDITVLVEALWWVDPAYRHTRAGVELLDAYTSYGFEHANWITVTERTEEPGRSAFTKRGFTLLERSYLLEVGQ